MYCLYFQDVFFLHTVYIIHGLSWLDITLYVKGQMDVVAKFGTDVLNTVATVKTTDSSAGHYPSSSVSIL